MTSAEVLFEACVESVEGAVGAVRAGGAKRLELCSRLDVGGLTPDPALIEQVLRRVDVPVLTMVRQREGDFVADAGMVGWMEQTIGLHKGMGVAGVVFGVLDREGRIDGLATERLVRAARPMVVTFHRAFDQTPDLELALDTLIGLGVDRVLTSGGAARAIEGATVLRHLVTRAAGRITIVAGGGVRLPDWAALAATGVREVHASGW